MSENKVSAVEIIKENSRFLRGDIAQELCDGNDFFSKESIQLLKHHGTYQQDDRDLRGKGEKAYSLMVRTRVPGGKVTSDQMLAHLDLGDAFGRGKLRVTSRQAFQLHYILKSNIREAIGRINQCGLSTLAACGDVCRNVMCCPAPYDDPAHQQMQQLADALAEHFRPRTRAYYELWLKDLETGEKELVGGQAEEDVEPIYGRHYLPRKFKIGIALPTDNCIDILTHDLGFLAIIRDGNVIGYNVLVGGGMGVTPTNKKTFPALAQPLAFVTPEQAIDVATAVVGVQRDFGNREDRKVARLKYLVNNWGLEKFKAKVEEYYGAELPAPEADQVTEVDDHMGWAEQGNGRLVYGLSLENGRIYDDEACQVKSAIREICAAFAPGIRLTAQQSLLFTDIDPANRQALEAILRKHHVPLSADRSTVDRWSMACVGLPTCGLAVTDSERALPGIIASLETKLEELGLGDEALTIHMTGCPNGCARPYNSDIGLVGKGRDKYTLLLGGSRLGTRLNFLYRDLVPSDEIVPTLLTLFQYFKQAREPGESFGDFCARKGLDDLIAHGEASA